MHGLAIDVRDELDWLSLGQAVELDRSINCGRCRSLRVEGMDGLRWGLRFWGEVELALGQAWAWLFCSEVLNSVV